MKKISIVILALLAGLASSPALRAAACTEPTGDASTLFSMINNSASTAANLTAFLQSHSVDANSLNDQCESLFQNSIRVERADLLAALYEHYVPDPNSSAPKTTLTIYQTALVEGNAQIYRTLESEAKLHGQTLSLGPAGLLPWPPLFWAAQAKNLSVVQAMIQEGADVNTTYTDPGYDTTALMVAVQVDGNTGVVEALLSAKANPNVTDTDGFGYSALMFAARQPHNQQIVQDLLNAGADPTKLDEFGESVLFDVTDPRIALMLIQAEAPVNAVDYNGTPLEDDNGNAINDPETPLKSVIDDDVGSNTEAAVATAQELIQAGASVTLGYPMDRVQSVAMAKLLIQSGASVNQNDGYGNALFYAANSFNSDLVGFLISQGADANATGFNGDSALNEDAAINSKIVATLLAAGADVNHQNKTGYTPLMWVALQNFDDSGSEIELIRAGANVNLTDHQGNTALILAANRLDSINLLIQSGANVNAANQDGTTALMHFAQEPQADATLQTLLAAGANVNAAAKDGTTALLNGTAIKGNVSAVQILLKGGANANEASQNGTTPLINASFLSRDVVLVTTLLASGANVNAADSNGMTALMYSGTPEVTVDGDGNEQYVFHPEIVKALLAGGANTALKNNSGQTALDIAKSEYAPEEILKLLGE